VKPDTTLKVAPMEILPLGPGFAAELRGVTLRDVAADDAAYAAFEEHSVLVVRGQEVADEGQLAFSRRFGVPEITRSARRAPARISPF
jgi:alpha-ketoglutarate-dependent 2,4-dichlorophenoxyacetate dioxygenase